MSRSGFRKSRLRSRTSMLSRSRAPACAGI